MTTSNSASLQQNSGQDRKRFQNPSLAMIELTPDGSVRQLSPAARNLLEYSAADDVSESFFSMIHGRQLYQVMRDVADMVCHGKTRATWLVRMRTARGRWKWFKADVYNRLDQAAHALEIVIVAV
ncbi:MAG: PAS domain-containing protein [Rhodothermales bacterium]